MTMTVKMKPVCKICGGTQKRPCRVCEGFGKKVDQRVYRMANGYQKEDGPCSCCEGEGKVNCSCVTQKAEPKKS